MLTLGLLYAILFNSGMTCVDFVNGLLNIERERVCQLHSFFLSFFEVIKTPRTKYYDKNIIV